MKTVVCVMLANGRPDMVRRAVAAFHAQEYDVNCRKLLIWNTGAAGDCAAYEDWKTGKVAVIYSEKPTSIGTLRNEANASALRLWPEADVLAHWDSDDWSHPRRLVECVELLENTRANLVGYRECLFWDNTIEGLRREYPSGPVTWSIPPKDWAGNAWIYRNPNPSGPIGSSFLYPRETWESTPFPNRHAGEDTLWLLKGSGRFKIHAVPSTWDFRGLPGFEPRMICAIHGANTTSKIVADAVEWKRAPQFDAYCKRKMAL